MRSNIGLTYSINNNAISVDNISAALQEKNQ